MNILQQNNIFLYKEMNKRVENMEYKIINESEAPQPVKDWLNKNKYKEDYAVIHTEKHTFILITRGEKKTGGYGLELTKLEKQDNKIAVFVEYTDPKPDQVVIQVVTYPYLIVKLEKTDEELIVFIQKKE